MVYDAVIVGAGPAGSRAAWRLASAGARVALVDASHPREKPCGGGVTGRALRLVADQLAPVSSLRPCGVGITRAVFIADGHRAAVDLLHGDASDDPPLLVFPREAFDCALLEAAAAAGADRVNVRAKDVRSGAGTWHVQLDGARTIEGRVLIGADGANSLVRRRVLEPFSRGELSIASGFFVRGATSHDIVVEFLSDPPGYLWAFPRADHLAVGVCAQADRSNVGTLRTIATRWIDREQVRGRADPYSWPIPSLSADAVRRSPPSGRGWLLVGDAAGLVDPITREGIYFALASGDLAADAILEGRDVGRGFRERLNDEIVPELARAAMLKSGFFRPAFITLLVRALQTSAPVRAVMADLVAGEQSYRTLSRRLLATLEIGLAWELVKMRRVSRYFTR